MGGRVGELLQSVVGLLQLLDGFLEVGLVLAALDLVADTLAQQVEERLLGLGERLAWRRVREEDGAVRLAADGDPRPGVALEAELVIERLLPQPTAPVSPTLIDSPLSTTSRQ
ncbi:hypothetical protein J2753_002388 [Halolamina salifodinae]|uniref:Uncharacterized protein n=1 Tax=Halolamina salifodinae TaxID=1202767 RepID=A0A8T4H3X6_9EURY|nr:hypothetical protein [Halolamina salifodinae]MBP1987878.1 hypothetical protein [Halolamina salifodinae]